MRITDTTAAAPTPIPPIDSKQIADAAKAAGRLLAGLLSRKGGGK
ncbi:hypothetical protein [Streptomyces kaniharaensis]|nr:hypothetical protein [Streptomyces kaniharaensis]